MVNGFWIDLIKLLQKPVKVKCFLLIGLPLSEQQRQYILYIYRTPHGNSFSNLFKED